MDLSAKMLLSVQFLVTNTQEEGITDHQGTYNPTKSPVQTFPFSQSCCFLLARGIKGHLGAAFARALAYCAFLCTKDRGGATTQLTDRGSKLQSSDSSKSHCQSPYSNNPIWTPHLFLIPFLVIQPHPDQVTQSTLMMFVSLPTIQPAADCCSILFTTLQDIPGSSHNDRCLSHAAS